MAAKKDKTALFTLSDRIAHEENFDPALLRAVLETESSGDQAALSPKGARGLMQLMPATARELGLVVSHTVDERLIPEKNIRAGARYLKQQLEKYGGDVSKALAAYNAGPGNVDKYGGIPPFKETQEYVGKILSRIMTNTAPVEPGEPEEEITVTEATGIDEAQEEKPTGEKEATSTESTTEEVSPSIAEMALNELVGRIFASSNEKDPESGEIRPVPLTDGQRLAAGIIAAISPDTYAKIVQPELERRGEMAAMESRVDATGANKDIQHLQALTSYLGLMEDRAARQALTKERLRIQELDAQSRIDTRTKEQEERERGLSEAKQIVDAYGVDIADLTGEITPIIENLTASNDPAKEARADSLTRQLAGTAGLIKQFSDKPELVGPATVGMLDRHIAALRSAKERAVAQQQQEDMALQRAQQRVAPKLIEDRFFVTNVLAELETAKKLIRQGTGGWFAGQMPETSALPGGQERMDLNAIYALVQPQRIKEQIGAAMTEHELRLMEGVIMDITASPSKQLTALYAVERSMKMMLKRVDRTFAEFGLAPPSAAFGWAEDAEADEPPEGAKFLYTDLQGRPVYQVGPSPSDLWAWEER